MKKYSILFICILLLASDLAAQTFQRERIYLQTDKQLYISGELLWMKLYTTNEEGKLTSFSKIGYVELFSDSIPELQTKLDIIDGTGSGCLELSTMLPTGYYRLIAYTRNMRNEGNEVFYEKTIAIINPYVRNEESIGKTGDVETVSFASLPQQTLHNEIISTDRSLYGVRSKGEIRLKNLPDENISLAVSIAGADPLYASGTPAVEWKKKLSSFGSERQMITYLPEYEGAIIEGKLMNNKTNEVEYIKDVSTLLSFPGKEIQLFGGKIKEDGMVSFFTHQINGRKEIAATAYTTYNNNSFRVDLVSPFATHTPISMPVLKIDSSWHDYLEQRNLAVQVLEAYNADSLSRVKLIPPYFNYKPYKEYILDEYTRFNRMDEIFVEFILPVRIRRMDGKKVFNTLNERLDGFSIRQTLVLLDNIPVMNHELMVDYNPLLVKKVDVYLGHYLFGGQIFEGIVSFSTYNNNYPGITFEENTQLFDYEGTQEYRYFYAPQYEANVPDRMPDFRHTLLWEPSLMSNGEKELVIPFSTSDLPGNYQVTVEGIGTNGSVVSASCFIEVK